MATCEKCWNDAHAGGDVAARYSELIHERHQKPCTPEDQAGIQAEICPSCKKKSIHQYVGVCMNFLCERYLHPVIPEKV